jgi:predicted dienelactone hydrolase
VFEQIRVFPWLTTPHRYLALIEGKAHLGTFSNLDAHLNLLLRRMTNLKGLNSSIFYSYINSLSLAFFEVYLAGNLAYTPYLQSSYAKYISQSPFRLSLISAASCRTASCDQIDRRLREFILNISQLS